MHDHILCLQITRADFDYRPSARALLEVAYMVVAWWIVAFLHSASVNNRVDLQNMHNRDHVVVMTNAITLSQRIPGFADYGGYL